MKKILKVSLSLLVIQGLLPHNIWAQTVDLEARLAQLEAEVAVLRRQIEINKEESANKSKDTPIITANAKDGFSIKSPDENFKLKIGGYVQADARTFTDNKKNADLGYNRSLFARRIRPVFSGTVAHDFDFSVMPDFGGSSPTLVDAYAEYKANPGAKVRVGKFKVPFSLEYLQSSQVNNFAELGLPSNLYPNRDIGIQLSGDLFKDRVNYAFGYFNGAGDRENLNSDTNKEKDFVGRLFVQPFKSTSVETLKGLGLGYAFSYGHRENTLSQSYVSPGQATVFTYGSPATPGGASTTITSAGPHLRSSPQAYFYNGSFGLIGEYVESQQELTRSSTIRDKFKNRAWQVTGNYVLTGELASFKGVVPRSEFDPSRGKWGAFELAGRYGQLKIDSSVFDEGFANLNTSISKEIAWASGLNWYLNRNVKLTFDFEQTKFERGAVGGQDRKPENVVTSRLQLSF